MDSGSSSMESPTPGFRIKVKSFSSSHFSMAGSSRRTVRDETSSFSDTAPTGIGFPAVFDRIRMISRCLEVRVWEDDVFDYFADICVSSLPFDYILPSTPGMCNVIFWRFCRYPLVTNRGFGQNDGRDAGWNGIQIAWLSNIRSCDIVGNG